MEDPHSSKHHVSLSGVMETSLISLYARAVDAQSQSPILGDTYASETVQQLDYDFSNVALSQAETSCVALRTRFFDGAVKSFLATHPASTILHLGCGLDSRAARVLWNADHLWVDVDLPAVVALRRQVMPFHDSTRDYRTLAADITKDFSWLHDIPNEQPTLIIMEGLASYLTTEQRNTLFRNLTNHFKAGELIFDCISSTVLQAGERARVGAVRHTGAEFRSALDSPKDLEGIHERLIHAETVCFVDLPYWEVFTWYMRFKFWALSFIPAFKDSVRFVKCSILSSAEV